MDGSAGGCDSNETATLQRVLPRERDWNAAGTVRWNLGVRRRHSSDHLANGQRLGRISHLDVFARVRRAKVNVHQSNGDLSYIIGLGSLLSQVHVVVHEEPSDRVRAQEKILSSSRRISSGNPNEENSFSTSGRKFPRSERIERLAGKLVDSDCKKTK